MPDALVIIDMQVGSFDPPQARHDAEGVVARLNRISGWLRGRGGVVVWVQHDGPPGDAHAPDSDGWRILPQLNRDPDDMVVRKTACDSFLATDLDAILRSCGGRAMFAGCATDFCVDTTIRAAVGRGFDTWAVADGHTTADRPYLAADKIIEHHNHVWAGLIAPGGPATVVLTADLLVEA